MKKEDFISRVQALVPDANPSSLQAYVTYAMALEQDRTLKAENFFNDMFVELVLIKQHDGADAARQVIDCGCSFTFNPFEMRCAAKHLKAGQPLEAVSAMALKGLCERTEQELEESYDLQEHVELFDKPRLYTGIFVSLRDAADLPVDALYDDAVQYVEKIADAIASFSTQDYPSNNLMQYIAFPESRELKQSVLQKVECATPGVQAMGKHLTTTIDLRLAAPLSPAEYDALCDGLHHQLRHGWGAEFELASIPVDSQTHLGVRLGDESGAIYSQNEMEIMNAGTGPSFTGQAQ